MNGGWGVWQTVSVVPCDIDPKDKVKQIRLCDSPPPQYGGDLCPDPEQNERLISCNETNFGGIYFLVDVF